MFGWLKHLVASRAQADTPRAADASPKVPEPSFTLPEEFLNIAFVLLSEAPSEFSLLNTLADAGMTLDKDSSPASSDDPLSFFASRDGRTYLISLAPYAIPAEEAESNTHPFFFPEPDALQGYSHHLVVADLPSFATRPAPRNTGEAVEAIAAHATLLAHLLGLPEALGVYSGRTATTYDAATFRGAVLDDPLPALFIAPLWLTSDKQEWHFYSYGLKDIGMPEVQVIAPRSSCQNPQEVYAYLMDIIGYIAQGNRIHAGETLGRSAQEKFTTSWAPWLVDDSYTALQINLNL